jgi:dienelactone hydrolase
MGGKIALALAARRPAGLSALVLLAPSPPTPEPIEEAMREKLIAGWGCYGPASETLAQVTGTALEGRNRERTIADMMGASRNAWAAWLQQGSREDISGCMERIEAPVRILTGDCDTILPTQLIEQEVASRLASAQLATVPAPAICFRSKLRPRSPRRSGRPPRRARSRRWQALANPVVERRLTGSGSSAGGLAPHFLQTRVASARLAVEA